MDLVPIDLEPVASSNLAALGYDPARRILAIQFRNNKAIRHYTGVDPLLAAEFGAAESKGRFYHARIKRQIPGRRVTGPCRNCRAEGYIGATCRACGTSSHFGVERYLRPHGEAA